MRSAYLYSLRTYTEVSMVYEGPHDVDLALTKSLELFAPIPAGPSIVDDR